MKKFESQAELQMDAGGGLYAVTVTYYLRRGRRRLFHINVDFINDGTKVNLTGARVHHPDALASMLPFTYALAHANQVGLHLGLVKQAPEVPTVEDMKDILFDLEVDEIVEQRPAA